MSCGYLYRENRNETRRVLLAVTGAHRIGRQLCGPLIARFSALIGLWLPTLTTLLGPVHAAFIYNAPLFCVVRRRSLELNPCRIKFIQKEGVALWQRRRRRRRAPAHRNRKRELRLEHRKVFISLSGRTDVRPLSSLLQPKAKRTHGC
jgi:hypothetical protein